MVSYYQHDISKWMDGTEKLSDGEYRAYHVLCELMYLNDGPIVVNERGFAGRCNQHVLAFRRNFESLVEKGKLILLDGGKVTNRRVETELTKIGNRRKAVADPLATPSQPPADPPRTSGQPPRGGGDKPLDGKERRRVIEERREEDSLFPDGKRAPARAGKTALAADWQPSIADLDYAGQHGFDRGRAQALAGAFADHHRSRGNRMADWSAAWRTWVRNEVKFNRPRGGGAPTTSTRAGGAHMALKKFNQQQEEGDGTDESGGDGRRSLPAGRGG